MPCTDRLLTIVWLTAALAWTVTANIAIVGCYLDGPDAGADTAYLED